MNDVGTVGDSDDQKPHIVIVRLGADAFRLVGGDARRPARCLQRWNVSCSTASGRRGEAVVAVLGKVVPLRTCFTAPMR